MTHEPYRFRCPNGHVSWQSRQNGNNDSDGRYYCESCRQNGVEPSFNELVDMKA